jgi:hypothetical protein
MSLRSIISMLLELITPTAGVNSTTNSCASADSGGIMQFGPTNNFCGADHMHDNYVALKEHLLIT